MRHLIFMVLLLAVLLGAVVVLTGLAAVGIFQPTSVSSPSGEPGAIPTDPDDPRGERTAQPSETSLETRRIHLAGQPRRDGRLRRLSVAPARFGNAGSLPARSRPGRKNSKEITGRQRPTVFGPLLRHLFPGLAVVHGEPRLQEHGVGDLRLLVPAFVAEIGLVGLPNALPSPKSIYKTAVE